MTPLRLALVAALGLALVGSSAVARPREAPPATTPGGPPAAWIELAGAQAWLARGSTCWTSPADAAGVARTLCADVPPRMDDVPTMAARAGVVARIHFRDAPPERVSITSGQRVDACEPGEAPSTPTGGVTRELDAGSAVVAFRVGPRDAGLAAVHARFPQGSVSYLLNLQVVSGPAGAPPPPCVRDRRPPSLEGLVPDDRFHVFLALAEAASVAGALERGDGEGGWVAVRPIVVSTDASPSPRVRLGPLNHHRRYRLVLALTDRAGNRVIETRRLIVGRQLGGGMRLLTLGPAARRAP